VLVVACALAAALALFGTSQLLDDDLPPPTTPPTTGADVSQLEPLPTRDVTRSTSAPYPVPPEPPEPPPEPPPTTWSRRLPIEPPPLVPVEPPRNVTVRS
jgi:hypothetical protein